MGAAEVAREPLRMGVLIGVEIGICFVNLLARAGGCWPAT